MRWTAVDLSYRLAVLRLLVALRVPLLESLFADGLGQTGHAVGQLVRRVERLGRVLVRRELLDAAAGLPLVVLLVAQVRALHHVEARVRRRHFLLALALEARLHRRFPPRVCCLPLRRR